MWDVIDDLNKYEVQSFILLFNVRKVQLFNIHRQTTEVYNNVIKEASVQKDTLCLSADRRTSWTKDPQVGPKFCCVQHKNWSEIQEDRYFTTNRLFSFSLKFLTFKTTEWSSKLWNAYHINFFFNPCFKFINHNFGPIQRFFLVKFQTG